MKNLKKVVALVLVVAMMASFAVTAGAANFTDKSSVKNTEAVEVMSTIGIIDGYADGSFKPEGTLTREQAAKIITYMKLGKTAADKLVATVAPYSDVAANRWSAGAIAYCTNEGILAGVGNGKFNPTGELTGLQFAKMLLVALGYDPKIEGLTGSAWAVNTAKLALDADLDDNINGNLSTALSRQDAAQMAFNTLKADMVEYDATTNVNVNGATVTVGNSKAKVQTTKKDWGKNIKDDAVEGVYTVQFAEKFLQDLKTVKTAKHDEFGRPATKWTWKNNEIGTYSDDADYTYNNKVSKKALYNDLGKDIYDDLKDRTNTTAKLNVYVDGQPLVDGETDGSNVDTYILKNNTGASAGTGNGSLTEVYVDDDNNSVTICVINTYLVQATADYSSKNENLKVAAISNITLVSSTLELDDFDISGYKDDDYILVTATTENGTRYDIQTVAPAKTVTGKVTEFTTGDDVTIAGTTYKYNTKFYQDEQTTKNDIAYSIGEETTVITDNNNYILYVDDAVVSSDKYVYIYETEKDGVLSSKSVKSSAYFLDGTNKVITLKKVLGVKAKDITKNATANIKGWYTYSVNSDDEYTLTAVESKYVTGSKAFTNETAATKVVENGKLALGTVELGENNTETAVKANASTVFVTLNSDDEVETYTGISKVPTIKASAGKTVTAYYVVKESNGYAAYVFIDMSNDEHATVDDKTSSATDYVFVLKADKTKQDANDNTYYTYKAIVDGAETVIKVADQGTVAAGNLYNKIKTNKDGYISGASQISNGSEYDVVNSVTGAAYSDSTLTISGKDYVLTGDTKIYMVAVKPAANKTNAIMDDANADYEITEQTGKSLERDLKDYKDIKGNVIAVREDDDDQTLVAMYVWITESAAK